MIQETRIRTRWKKRRASPTACRDFVNVLLTVVVVKTWVLMTADGEATFLKGEAQDVNCVLCCWPLVMVRVSRVFHLEAYSWS